jgi:hypothetical protein
MYAFLQDLGYLGILFLAFCIGVVIYLMKQNVIFYAIVGTSDFVSETKQIIESSNVNNTHNVRYTPDINSADIVIRLVPRKELTKYHSKIEYYPGSQKQIRFSFTWQKPKPHIAIDNINWRDGVPESGLTLSQYRRYVIQHEFMHALGYDHQPCNAETAPGGVCPVLYQSTRGPPAGFKCGHEITEFDYGKKIPGSYY